VTHRGVVRLVRDTDYLQITPVDRVAQASSPSFDATTFEVCALPARPSASVGKTHCRGAEAAALGR
jgi:hypothetical protein